MRVLVTGGAGFVGSHLCDRLLREGNEVVALDNLITGAVRNLEAIGLSSGRPGLSFVQADLCAGVPVEGRFDRVYHLASPASPIDYVVLPFETLYVGSDGTRAALERAAADGARLLLASTSEVYGDPAIHPQREDYWGNVNPIGPRSVYDEAKRYAEALTMAFHRYRGVEVRIIRIFNTYGPRMRAEDGRVVPTFIRQALRGEPLTVFGDGSQTRSFCYVDDLVDGMIRLMESGMTGPCNVGNPHELSMLEFAGHINRVTGNPGGLLFKPLPTDDPTRRRPDISLAREALGWEPQVDFAEGIARTIAYFEAEGLGQT
ncbi:MAG: SDR family oxidoreductase [Deltaproteobacteria bacterium]|nr:SDR family oxidoreductase [Deltaproteobacteria bacterium]